MSEVKPVQVLSLGAGVQSSMLALASAKGEITPMPDCAIFSDTQAETGYKTRNNPKGEREGLYAWLDWLEGELPYPVHTVTGGNLTEEVLKTRYIKKDGCKTGPRGTPYLKQIIPVFGLMPDGKKTAAIGRVCTSDYKIIPIHRAMKELYNIKRGEKETKIIQWIGISWDEMQRQKDSRVPFIENRFPLLEQKMERHHCKEWMEKNGYPEPPRSACYYCPFHTDDEWRDLRDNNPKHFQEAIEFDEELRRKTKTDSPNQPMTMFLHNSAVPLSEVDFDNDEDKGQLTWDFSAECEGLCGT